jgi:hypothetical protein
MEPLFDVQTPLGLLGAIQLFIALIIGHCLADFPLQGEYLALFKNRHHLEDDEMTKHEVVWPYVLSAHALIHMGTVWIITGSFILGAMEFALHWVIDYAKCEKWTNYHVDQALHVICKVLYIGLVMTMGAALVV